MSEEEKDAYKYLEQAMFEEETTEKYVNILLNYIDKLQEENIKLKEDSISKDIIRNKIKELEDKMNNGECKLALHEFQIEAQIRILKELLGE